MNVQRVMFQPPEEVDQMRSPVQMMNEPSPQEYTSYIPAQLQKHDEFLESVSKQTLILVFAAFFIGLLLGKSMTPVVLRQ